MCGWQRRARTSLRLLAVFGICWSLQSVQFVSGKDKVLPSGTTAIGEDSADSSNASATNDPKPPLKKPAANSKSGKSKARPETARKKKSGDQTEPAQGTSQSAVDSTIPGTPSIPGGGSGSSSPGAQNAAAPVKNLTTGTGSNSKPASSTAKDRTNNDPVATTTDTPSDGPGPNPALVKRVMDVQNRITPELIAQKGIVGTCTGLDEDGNVVVKVYTTGTDNPTIPKSVDGVAVVEILTGLAHPLYQLPPFSPKARLPRPVPIGVSAGPTNSTCAPTLVTDGTIGCRLKDKSGNVYVLGCSHNFANENKGAVGDSIIQPDTTDGFALMPACPPTDSIGTLFKFTTIIFNFPKPTPVNKIDAAVVKTDVSLVGNSTPPPPIGYGTPRTTPYLTPYLGQPVQKYGKRTGLTTGKVTGLNQTASAVYFSGIATFVGQIEFSNNAPFFALPGDSGALVVTMDNHPVAMVYSQVGNLISGTPIQEILNHFNMTIDGDNVTVITPPGKEGRARVNSP